MVISCSVLVWAIVRLVRLKKSRSEKMVNKIMITIHIVAYLFIIIASALTIWVPINDLREFKISQISTFVVYCVCSVLFGVIVYQLTTKT